MGENKRKIYKRGLEMSYTTTINTTGTATTTYQSIPFTMPGTIILTGSVANWNWTGTPLWDNIPEIPSIKFEKVESIYTVKKSQILNLFDWLVLNRLEKTGRIKFID